MIPEKPYALSCDKNSEPILNVLKKYLPEKGQLLEIAAGTGQHAIFMAPHFPGWTWLLADRKDRHEGIKMWLKDFPRSNVQGPILYGIGENDFPKGEHHVVYAANLIHIISWNLCLKLFDELGNALDKNAFVMFYGAYNYNGDFTTESNKKFDEWLKEKDPNSGIRDFEKVRDEMKERGFELAVDEEMPANNRMLIFSKQ